MVEVLDNEDFVQNPTCNDANEHAEKRVSLLEIPLDTFHFIMFHLELRDVISLLFVCKTWKDIIQKHSNHFWYTKYQVSAPFEWLHRLQHCNRVFQEEKRESSIQNPGYMILQDLGMTSLVSHKSKIPAHTCLHKGNWHKMKQEDHNPRHYKHLNPVKTYYSSHWRSYGWSKMAFPEPSSNLCQELQFCDFPEVLYLVTPGLAPWVAVEREFVAGRYSVTWRLAVDENASLGDIKLRVYDQLSQVIANDNITANELHRMRGKGWFVHTMKASFTVEDTIFRTKKIMMQCPPEVSGLWVDWLRIVNRTNKAMLSFMKNEETALELTVQKVAEKTKRGNRRK